MSPGEAEELERQLRAMSPEQLETMMKQMSAGDDSRVGGLGEQLTQQYSTEAMLNKVDAEGGVLVRPTPGFVVKTDDLESGQKIFINVCSSDYVEKPHEKSMPNSDEMGIRVPLSVGVGEEDFDKKSQPCVTYDVVVNPDSVAASEDDANFRHMVMQLVLGAVGQKYSLQLNPQYRLPKMKYKGPDPTRPQRLKVKNESRIEEVESKQHDIDHDAAPELDFSVRYEAEGDDPIDGLTLLAYSEEATLQANLKSKVFNQGPMVDETKTRLASRTAVFTVEMPEVKTLHGAQVDVSDECARVSSTGLKPSTLMLWFPFEFCSRYATCEWLAATKQLILSVPCSPFVGAAPGEDPSIFDNPLADVAF